MASKRSSQPPKAEPINPPVVNIPPVPVTLETAIKAPSKAPVTAPTSGPRVVTLPDGSTMTTH